jgi:tRNA U54 and U55 pseudouridine synthase Pus10
MKDIGKNKECTFIPENISSYHICTNCVGKIKRNHENNNKNKRKGSTIKEESKRKIKNKVKNEIKIDSDISENEEEYIKDKKDKDFVYNSPSPTPVDLCRICYRD